MYTYLQLLLNDSPNPCSVSDMETDEVVYVNRAMAYLLKDTEFAGSKICYKRVYGFEERCNFCNNENLREGKFTENYIYNENLHQHFKVYNSLVVLEGRKYNLCKYAIVSVEEDVEFTYEEAMNECMEILKKEKIDDVIEDFLALLGKFYKCEKAYIHQFSSDGVESFGRYQWIADDSVVVAADVTKQVPLEDTMNWLKEKNELGIVEANCNFGNYTEDSVQARILKNLDLKNIALCTMEDVNRQLTGAVGVSNRTAWEYDYRLLKAIAHFMEDSLNRHNMQKSLQAMNETDTLTGFYSRTVYARKLNELEKSPPKNIGVVFVNINGLRKTNEYFGFAKGDSHIKKSAETLKMFFSEPFYRISGDEFVCFITDIEEQEFQIRVERLQENMKVNKDYSFAVGHAWKQGRAEMGKLISEADTMMYINKQEYYYASHSENAEISDGILSDLLSYISNDEFLVYLQPQIRLSDGMVTGAEALIRRFDKKNHKMVFPDQFIPLYEEKSVIRHVDIFVLNKVCQLLSLWGKNHRQVPISVNLSRVTLMEFGIVKTIAKVCDNHGIDHRLIVVEVTERIGLIESDVASSLIDEFKDAGFAISLDDFGCAYSNIVTLAKINVDEVKIDKSLIDNILTSEKNKKIVGNMLDLCNSFDDTHTLAEGIEEQAQADLLRDLGCIYGQGYLYSRPIPSEEFFEKYIENT